MKLKATVGLGRGELHIHFLILFIESKPIKLLKIEWPIEVEI